MSDDDKDIRAPYVPRTKAEIEELAQDIWSGRVFTSEQVKEPNMIPAVFMPMMFLSSEDHKPWFEENKIAVLYEEMSKSAPRSVNGYPIFMSMRMLNLDDAKAVFARAKEINDIMGKRKEEADA